MEIQKKNINNLLYAMNNENIDVIKILLRKIKNVNTYINNNGKSDTMLTYILKKHILRKNIFDQPNEILKDILTLVLSCNPILNYPNGKLDEMCNKTYNKIMKLEMIDQPIYLVIIKSYNIWLINIFLKHAPYIANFLMYNYDEKSITLMDCIKRKMDKKIIKIKILQKILLLHQKSKKEIIYYDDYNDENIDEILCNMSILTKKIDILKQIEKILNNYNVKIKEYIPMKANENIEITVNFVSLIRSDLKVDIGEYIKFFNGVLNGNVNLDEINNLSMYVILKKTNLSVLHIILEQDNDILLKKFMDKTMIEDDILRLFKLRLKNKYSSLDVIFENRSYKCLRILLERDIELDFLNDKLLCGKFPIEMLIKDECVNLIILLLNRVKCTHDNAGLRQNLFMTAIMFGSVNVLLFLLKYAKQYCENIDLSDLHYRDQDGNNLIHLLCLRVSLTSNHLKCIRLINLFDENMIYEKNNFGQTLLHLSSLQKTPKLLIKLIELGVDINDTCNKNFNVAHYIAKNGTIEMMEYIIMNFGELLNETTNENMNMLSIAYKYNNIDVANYLYEKTSEENRIMTDIYGNNASHYAFQHFEIISLCQRPQISGLLDKVQQEICNDQNLFGMRPIDYFVINFRKIYNLYLNDNKSISDLLFDKISKINRFGDINLNGNNIVIYNMNKIKQLECVYDFIIKNINL